MFDFCRMLGASTQWIKYIEKPQLLMGEKALIMGCATNLRLLLECKQHYSQDFLNFVDYVMDTTKLTGQVVPGFVKFI